jgi:hypothetical protein
VAGLKEEIFPFAITYTEQELGADFVTDVGTSNFHIVLKKKQGKTMESFQKKESYVYGLFKILHRTL